MGSQCVYWSQTLMKSEREQFCPIFSFLWVKLRYITSLLVRFEILQVFVNTLMSDDNYCNSNAIIEKNQEPFYQFLIAFLEFASNFQHFEKKYDPPSSSTSAIINSKYLAT